MTYTEERKMTRGEFWARFAVWIALAVIAPVVYVIIAYGLFTSGGDETKLSGWGIIAVIFVCIMLLVIVNEAKKGLKYGSFVRQCVDGLMTLIPLLGCIVIIHAIKDNVSSFESFLVFMFICEALAIPANPMRKWAEQNNLERADNFVVSAIKKALGKNEKK